MIKNTIFVLMILTAFSGCKKEGCMNSSALNFNSEAEKDDGTCSFSKVIFWARYNQYQVGSSIYDVNSITLSAGGSNAGNVTSIYGAAPSCGASGCITYQIKGGANLSWSAAIELSNGNTITKSGTAKASANLECVTVQIDQ